MVFTRILAFVGLAISLILIVMKATGKITSVVGCGGEGSCAEVLGSQWSQWFGIPVSWFSLFFYLGLLVLTFRAPGRLLAGAAWLLLGAAAWFMGLQFFVLEAFCPWCLATHLTGVTAAATIFWKGGFCGKPITVLIPLGMLGVLAAGQIYGPKPKTYEVTNEEQIAERKEVKVQVAGAGRVITFTGPSGQVVKTYRLGPVPLLGSPEAPHVLVKYFDYTCASCRDMEGDLKALIAAYPGQIAVIVLPTPLNRSCNPYLKPGVPDHAQACEFARLGLAAWRASPESFPEVHELLFERPLQTVESARKRIGAIVGAESLEAALADPKLEELLKANLEDYRSLSASNAKMPKLVMKGARTMHGLASSTERFVQFIATTLEIR